MRLSRRVGALPGIEEAGADDRHAFEQGVAARGRDSGCRRRARGAERSHRRRARCGCAAARDAAADHARFEKPAQPSAGLRAATRAWPRAGADAAARISRSSPCRANSRWQRRARRSSAACMRMIFSDNVPLDDEVALKRLAREQRAARHGTRLRHGAHRGRAARVRQRRAARRHRHRLGVGHRHCRRFPASSRASAAACRTASASAGATSTSASARWDAGGDRSRSTQDPGNETHRPDLQAARAARREEVLQRLQRSARNAPWSASSAWMDPTLTDAAEQAMQKKLAADTPPPGRAKGRVLGLYCGGTLAAEAELLLKAAAESTFVDLGDDQFTRGRPHPMIEPELRNEHIRAALADPAIGVLLFDLVLGFGAHADPAGVLVQVRWQPQDRRRFGHRHRAGSAKPARQMATLREAGVQVAPSNALRGALARAIVYLSFATATTPARLSQPEQCPRLSSASSAPAQSGASVQSAAMQRAALRALRRRQPPRGARR